MKALAPVNRKSQIANHSGNNLIEPPNKCGQALKIPDSELCSPLEFLDSVPVAQAHEQQEKQIRVDKEAFPSIGG
jgi:hypothetical protein